MQGAGLLTEKVPGGIVRRRRLRNLIITTGLDSVDQVGETDGILDEEDGDVVADDVKIALVGVEPGCEAVNVAGKVGATAATSDGREADEDGGFFIFAVEEGRGGDVGEVAVRGEYTVGTCATSMDSALGDLYSLAGNTGPREDSTHPLMVKTLNLLTEDKVLQQSRPTLAGLETVLILDRTANVGGHVGILIIEVVLREKFLRRLCRILIACVATIELAGHVRAHSIGSANEAKQAEGTHGERRRKERRIEGVSGLRMFKVAGGWSLHS
jgi:hypothetical protein